jgi:TetR/AcrR family transcriptional regulator, hemagglutinin/protease regulatory protein
MFATIMAKMPRKTPRSHARAKRLDPSERRPQLLQCAMHVFARRGLGGARHSEIAREAKVSVPTVFFYFPTREALVKAVLDEVARFLTDMTVRIHASGKPAPEVVLTHAKAFANSVDTHPDYARVWLDWSTALRDEIWPLYLEFQENIVAIIANTIRRWQRERGMSEEEAEDDARLLVGSAHMIAQLKFTRCAPEKIEHFLHTLVRSTLPAGG